MKERTRLDLGAGRPSCAAHVWSQGRSSAVAARVESPAASSPPAPPPPSEAAGAAARLAGRAPCPSDGGVMILLFGMAGPRFIPASSRCSDLARRRAYA